MKRSAAVVTAVLGLAGSARADVERGGIMGLRVFNQDNGFGVDDGPDADSQKNTALFGLRLGVYFTPQLGAEAEVGVLPSEGRARLYDVWNLTYRASAVMTFRPLLDRRLVPFALVGGGLHTIVSSANEDALRPTTAPVAHLGGGVKLSTNNGFGVRFDARALLVPSSQSSSVTLDFELLAAVYRDFGWTKPPVVVKPPPEPPKDEDPDKDGVLGDADRCPTEPEDLDDFQDDDGCPDPDNDADGVADADDKCPAELEDRDGFADDDGCPDPDNDADGVLDVSDKCPADLETRNGYQDDDGCPDELPAALRALVDAPLAVPWKGVTADLAPGADKLLDGVAAVLAEIPDVKLEIGAHTDDAALPRGSKYADNGALSQARAEAILAYLLGKGVDPARLTTKGYGDTVPLEATVGLNGAQLAAARAKNRRVELKVLVTQPVGAPAAPPPPPAPGPTMQIPAPGPATTGPAATPVPAPAPAAPATATPPTP